MLAPQNNKTGVCFHAASDKTPRIISRQSSVLFSSPSPSKKINKRVRFAVDGYNTPVEQVYTYDAIPKELVEKLFWTRKEQASIRAEQERLARDFIKNTPQLVDSIYYLHGYDIKKKCKVDSSDKLLHSMHIDTAKSILSESDSRGLEPFLTNLISEHRQWAVDKLLDAQSRCHKEGKADQVHLLMHIWSLRVSEAPCNFAHQLALGDEKAAWNTELTDRFDRRNQTTRPPCHKRGNSCDAQTIAVAA